MMHVVQGVALMHTPNYLSLQMLEEREVSFSALYNRFIHLKPLSWLLVCN